MLNCGKVCGEHWGKAMEMVRKSLLKSPVLQKRSVKVVKKSNIYTLDLHKLIQECAKELADYKIKITESTIST